MCMIFFFIYMTVHIIFIPFIIVILQLLVQLYILWSCVQHKYIIIELLFVSLYYICQYSFVFLSAKLQKKFKSVLVK